MLSLRDPDLLRDQAYFDGQWRNADNQARLPVYNPADGSLLGTVPNLGATETRQAIAAAERAWPAWRALLAKERAALLWRWYELILAHRQDLAHIMTCEQGKPLAEALGEVNYGAGFVKWFAEEAPRVYGDIIPTPFADKRILVTKQAIGVVAAITPWNFPLAMITRKCAPALAAGCPVVVKPAESTPLTALALAVLAERAGLPPGVLNVVTGLPAPIGREMTENLSVRKLSFTGSTATGKLLMRQCADQVKKISLELGGNAPFIVFDDADLDLAVQGALASKYRNSGQTCVCANRLLVQDRIYDQFAERFGAAVANLKVGNGLAADTHQGPLINAAAVQRLEAYIEDALQRGARLVCGGRRHALGGTFFEPTVLAEVTPHMRVAQEEIFGPIAPLFRFHTEAEAIALANATEYGLAAYFYSRDIGRVWRVSEALEYGIVGVNTGVVSTEVAPFGGFKESGIGREGSKYGIEEYLELKTICLGL